MKREEIQEIIRSGRTALGIELGSTRIKSVLIDAEKYTILASGSFQWENRLENGLWTYHLDDAIRGLQESYADLAKNVREDYGIPLKTIGAIGISGMMHGYLALDQNGRQLAPFLTWRNTNTTEAAGELMELFQFNIPLRWSIAQLYQAILEGQAHVSQIDYITTLAGYIHLRLSGERVLGIGEASGMFPIDSGRMDYDAKMLAKFDDLVAGRGYPWRIKDILPRVLVAGDNACKLTAEGAKLLDPGGSLRPGIPMAPPEGDAGTGMVATNSVEACTGNVSAGTSIFSMVVLEKRLSRIYKDIDMVTTPSGRPVAMVHCNNGTSEIDAWIRLFREFATACGLKITDGEIYRVLFQQSLQAAADCDGVLLFNYLSGEPVTGLTEGRPLLVRGPNSKLTLANFMRSQIYSVFSALAVGMKILEKEQVRIKRLTGHGGLFKTPGVAQRLLAAAMGSPITVMETAGEGGPYGMALLTAYMLNRQTDQSLEDYLQKKVFGDTEGTTCVPNAAEQAGYARYLEKYCQALRVEEAAVNCVR